MAPVPPPLASSSEDEAIGDDVAAKKKMKSCENGKERGIVLGRNVHSTCLDITEPEVNDEVTGDKEAYMAAVLARYRQSLLERTKHHLGMI